MQFKKLKNSDLEVSAVTFGAWAAGGWLWGGTEKSEAVKAIKASYDLGVTSIDTAPVYGQGTSELIVGEAIKDIPRDKVQILTKYGLDWESNTGEFFFKSEMNDGTPIDIYRNSSKQRIIKECEDSLKNLGTDYIDLYQIHWPDPTTAIQETMEAVDQLIKEGKVRYAGVCNYSKEEMMEAEKYISLVSNQVKYSMITRKIEEELIPYTIGNNKAILAYSPLERGLLTGKVKTDTTFGKGDNRADSKFYSNENIININAFLREIKPIADDHHISITQLVIAWTLAQPGITVALVGARDAQQSTHNAKAAEVKLSDIEISSINEKLTLLTLN